MTDLSTKDIEDLKRFYNAGMAFLDIYPVEDILTSRIKGALRACRKLVPEFKQEDELKKAGLVMVFREYSTAKVDDAQFEKWADDLLLVNLGLNDGG